MSRKRPGFDILLGESSKPGPAPAPAPGSGPGPMAAAIAETATSLERRQRAEAAIRAENDAIAHEHVRLERLGLIVRPVPLWRIRTGKLIRDRDSDEDSGLDELMTSIRETGLSNPIRLERVVAADEEGDGDGDGGGGTAGESGESYELIQGWRRLNAFRRLMEETGDMERWGAIPALISEPGETLIMLYRRMVDENLMRRDVSLLEQARLALDFARDPRSGVESAEVAVGVLYESLQPQRRSYIRGFLPLAEQLGDVICHPGAIARDAGLEIAAALQADPALAAAIRARLRQMLPRSPGDEAALLRQMAAAARKEAFREDTPRENIPRGNAPRENTRHEGRRRLRFSLGPEGDPEGDPAGDPGASRIRSPAQVTIAPGLIEIRLDADFTGHDRARLARAVSQAVAALLADLEPDGS